MLFSKVRKRILCECISACPCMFDLGQDFEDTCSEVTDLNEVWFVECWRLLCAVENVSVSYEQPLILQYRAVIIRFRSEWKIDICRRADRFQSISREWFRYADRGQKIYNAIGALG
jgi:hypothetical protein